MGPDRSIQTGSYELDPSLPLQKTPRCGSWHRHKTPPTANFHARHGNITAKLGVKGGGKGVRWSGKWTGVWKDEKEGVAVQEVLAGS